MVSDVLCVKFGKFVVVDFLVQVVIIDVLKNVCFVVEFVCGIGIVLLLFDICYVLYGEIEWVGYGVVDMVVVICVIEQCIRDV